VLQTDKTGSGKSYSMYGVSHLAGSAGGMVPRASRKSMAAGELPDAAGFIPRYCSTLFRRLNAAGGGVGTEEDLQQKLNMVEACYFEIYNERVRCCLCPLPLLLR